MSNMRARSLPRVREALEKAERARFYKQRTNKYTDEVRLVQAQTELENKRIAALARVKEHTMDLRMQALSIRDEEAAFLESDEAALLELARKVELNKRRNFLQEVKYKPRRLREQFVDRFERWKAEDTAEANWRVEMPPRAPQVQLNDQLIYPAKRERKQNRQLYMQITRRPDSQLGQKALRRLRDLYTDDDLDGATDSERAFFQELQLQLQGSDGEADDEEQLATATPFVTQQLKRPGVPATQQELSAQRVLRQVEATRRAIRYWELPASVYTQHQLGECCHRRRYRVRRLRVRPERPPPPLTQEVPDDPVDGEGKEATGDEEEEAAEAAKDLEIENSPQLQQSQQQQPRSFRKPGHRRMSTRLEGVPEDGESGSEAATAEDAERERVRRMSQRLSRGFRPEDFNRRRESLMRDLDEEEVSPVERQRRMAEFERAWTEVLKCKYIRGYEPADMRLPEGQSATDFVFGEEQARALDKIVEEASAAAATKEAAKVGKEENVE